MAPVALPLLLPLIVLVLLVAPTSHAFHLARLGQQALQSQSQQQQQQSPSTMGSMEGEAAPTDRAVALADRVPRRARSIKRVRCPTCLSADSDEFVFVDELLAGLGATGGGEGGARRRRLAGLQPGEAEELSPSDLALRLYADKVWLDRSVASDEEEAEWAVLAEAAVARWALPKVCRFAC